MRMHTYLLRRELLRRLGYKIPALKYLPKVTVVFPDAKTRDNILLNELPFDAVAPTTHWCRVSPAALAALQKEYQQANPDSKAKYPCVADPALTDTNTLDITFQDVAAMPATSYFYNVDYGPPVDEVPGTTNLAPEAQRVFRALALIYAIVDVPDSINQMDWNVGLSRDGNYAFTLPDQVNFSCTIEDALWILRRIAPLTRDDFTKIVAGGSYPEPVAKVLVEKLISRRDSLVTAFTSGGLRAALIPYDPKPTELPQLKDGKIVSEDWPGYADDFAVGDPQSPLHGLQWYALSLAQSNAMTELLDWANGKIPALTADAAAAAHNQDLLQQGLNQYLSTGTAQQVKLGTPWIGPTASGNVSINRSVIFGNYLGMNNLVQLADTFSFGGNVGLVIGFDGLPTWAKAQVTAGISANVSFTRVKPLPNLKDGITEPLDETFVPWITEHLAGIFKTVNTDLQTASTLHTPGDFDQLRDRISKDLTDLKTLLGVGEALIMSYNIAGSEKLTAAVAELANVSPGADVGFEADQITMHRLNFYRKDENTLQLYKDGGLLGSFIFSGEFTISPEAQLPILTFTGKKSIGDGQMQVFTLNINPDIRQNPTFTAVAMGVSNALRFGSVSTLEAAAPSGKASVHFSDSSTNFQFLHWVHRSLQTTSKAHAQLPDGTAGDYLMISDGTQNGDHYQKLATEVGTFLWQRFTGLGGAIDTNANSNPGQSFLGNSETKDWQLQAQVSSGVVSPLVRFQHRWEGWKITAADLWKIINAQSKQFGFALYPQDFLGDTQDLELYEVQVNLVFYDAAMKKLFAMADADVKALETGISNKNLCQFYWDPQQRYRLNGDNMDACYALLGFKDAYASWKQGDSDPAKVAKAEMESARWLQQMVDFPTLVRLSGGANNLWVSAQITGYRQGSEQASDPMLSQTYGACIQPDFLHCSPGTAVPSGVVDIVEQLLGVQDGEFRMQWLREVL
jgi:hypothetical protein